LDKLRLPVAEVYDCSRYSEDLAAKNKYKNGEAAELLNRNTLTAREGGRSKHE
jgi:hypothetical protein